jgi:hypothetical protein
VQIGVGLPLTRHSLSLGRKAKSRVSFQDPAALGRGWELEELETHNSDIQRIFEKFQDSVTDADKKTVDDINDIVWFILIVWSIFSSLLFVLFETGLPICMISVVVLAIATIISYIYGHRGPVNGYFEDDLSHLEYHVKSRMKVLGDIQTTQIQRVIWKTKGRRKALADFCMCLSPRAEIQLNYHIGIPSDVPEQFTIEGENDQLEEIATRIQEKDIPPEWEVLFEGDGILKICNLNKNINLQNNGTFIESHEEPVYLGEMADMLLSLISTS